MNVFAISYVDRVQYLDVQRIDEDYSTMMYTGLKIDGTRGWKKNLMELFEVLQVDACLSVRIDYF